MVIIILVWPQDGSSTDRNKQSPSKNIPACSVSSGQPAYWLRELLWRGLRGCKDWVKTGSTDTSKSWDTTDLVLRAPLLRCSCHYSTLFSSYGWDHGLHPTIQYECMRHLAQFFLTAGSILSTPPFQHAQGYLSPANPGLYPHHSLFAYLFMITPFLKNISHPVSSAIVAFVLFDLDD